MAGSETGPTFEEFYHKSAILKSHFSNSS